MIKRLLLNVGLKLLKILDNSKMKERIMYESIYTGKFEKLLPGIGDSGLPRFLISDVTCDGVKLNGYRSFYQMKAEKQLQNIQPGTLLQIKAGGFVDPDMAIMVNSVEVLD